MKASQPFSNMYFTVKQGVFIPRWETAEWTTALAFRLRELKDHRRKFAAVDLCTGSGCIPIFLKAFLQGKHGFPKDFQPTFLGVDLNPEAVKVAKLNALLHKNTIREYISPLLILI
jgi:methylase of polypeptide subunit release factors